MNIWSWSGKVWLPAIEGQCLCAWPNNEDEGQSIPVQVDNPAWSGQAIETHSASSWNNESGSDNVFRTLDSSNINIIPNSTQAPN
jgi:hypothetical protein